MKNIILILLLFLTIGCANYRELNDLAIVSAVGIESKDNEFIVSMQVINPSQISNDKAISKDTPTFTIYTGKGDTVQEALRNIVITSSKRVYSEHIMLLIFNEEVIKNHLDEVLDIAIRDSESRKEYYVITIKDSNAKEFLSTITPQDTINAAYIKDLLKTNESFSGNIIPVTYSDIIASYLNNRKTIHIPILKLTKLTENQDNINNIKNSIISTEIEIDGTLFIKNKNDFSYITSEEGKYYSFAMNNINKTIINDYCDKDNKFAIDIEKSNSLYKYNNNIFTINIKGFAKLNEYNCKLNTEKNKNVDMLNKIININIKNEIEKIFKENQSKGIDIFNIKDYLYKNENKIYKNVNNYWDIFFKTINLKVNVDIQINDTGNTLKEIN